ncbi:MAG: hypothetical protein NDF54_00050 [archaeon GB-1867-035]|nr:hypothetical protein [Candidatus Culexmicrobium profundum]
MKLNEIIGAITALILAYFLANLLTSGFAELGLFPYAGRAFWLTPPGTNFYQIGQAVGQFLWRLRSIDVLAQVLVLFSSALGVVCLLREEKEK